MGKSLFQLKWLKDNSWVQKSSDIEKVHCRVCMKNIEIGGMGESALKSHEKGESHKENLKIQQKQGSCDLFLLNKKGFLKLMLKRLILTQLKM
jgi:hypothetical protein